LTQKKNRRLYIWSALRIIRVTKNKDLDIKINRFNQMCSITRKLNNKTKKETQQTFYKAMAVPILTHGSQILTTKNQEAETENAEMNYLRSVARYASTGQIRNTKIREELNICNK
jgi:hypothetical protein